MTAELVRANSAAFESGRNYVEGKAKEIGLAMDKEDLLIKHSMYLSAVMTLRACFPERGRTIGEIDDWEWKLFVARNELFDEREKRNK